MNPAIASEPTLSSQLQTRSYQLGLAARGRDARHTTRSLFYFDVTNAVATSPTICSDRAETLSIVSPCV